MEGDRLRILLVGDASNCHNALAAGLRKLGHQVTVASDGTRWMDTGRDIDLSRRWNNKLGGLELWLRALRLRDRMSGYDVVSIATQGFIDLRPVRQRKLYDYLRRMNRSIFYTSLGTDSNYVEQALDPDCGLRYTEYKWRGEPTPFLRESRHLADAWLSEPLKGFCDYIYDTVDGAVSVLYEYDVALRRRMASDRVAYGGIPVDVDSLEPVVLPDNIDCVRFFLGRHKDRLLEKGGEIMEAAVREVVSRHPGRCEVIVVENRPYAEYIYLLRSAHVVLDQLYSYTPATNALLAMAYGLVAVSGGEEEYYDFIGEHECRPVINGLPDYDSLVSVLEGLVLNPAEIVRLGRMGRDFVKRHNDDTVVARRFVDFWKKRLEEQV
ncbi:MAG: glycosyltransferase family 1 protein [Duncaniella sp.]|nr:glycosyltransferase family 1 protein [Duncaniella sp.]